MIWLSMNFGWELLESRTDQAPEIVKGLEKGNPSNGVQYEGKG